MPSQITTQSSGIMHSQAFFLPTQSSGIEPSHISTLSALQSHGNTPGQCALLPVHLLSKQTSPVFPSPLSPFTLTLLHSNISVCSGCHQRFPRKPTAEYADPPYNMAIQHVEPRMYDSPITGMPISKVGNAYYHVYLPCLQSNWPTVSAIDITIPLELQTTLQYEHKVLLLHNLGITL